LAQLDTALKAVITAEEAERKLRNSRTETVEAARAAGVLSETEAELLERARRLAFEIITVDDFAPEEIGAGMRGHNRRGLDAASSRGETPSSTIVPAARSTS
jgi:acyl-CoA dehydrogenase